MRRRGWCDAGQRERWTLAVDAAAAVRAVISSVPHSTSNASINEVAWLGPPTYGTMSPSLMASARMTWSRSSSLVCRYGSISLRTRSAPINATMTKIFVIASVRTITSGLDVSCRKKSNGDKSPMVGYAAAGVNLESTRTAQLAVFRHPVHVRPSTVGTHCCAGTLGGSWTGRGRWHRTG